MDSDLARAQRKYVAAAGTVLTFIEHMAKLDPPDEELLRDMLEDAEKCQREAMDDIEKYKDESCRVVVAIFERAISVLTRRLKEISAN